MKKIFVSLFLFTLLFSACEKKDSVQSNENPVTKQNISVAAKGLSEQHDIILAEMLAASQEQFKQKAPDLNDGENHTFNPEQVFEIIEAVTGVKPEIIAGSVSVNQFKVPATENNLPTYDFDQEEINLSLHANSVLLKPYFDEVDLIVNDCMIDVNDKIIKISTLQQDAQTDEELSCFELENFMNSTEVLKGSLLLWGDFVDDDAIVKNSNGIMYAKSPTEWSLFKKIAFVAAADAVGAVAGTFVGSYIIVNGVPVYIPAGPQGAAAGLAILSFIAAKMVGW
ncbi:MAG: hypothetical protein BWY08_00471 [Bacteroidetes bacterium ADurb.Bin174]|jgi:hypothetical protein|nr:MAG: hypothetical protein BWY08_00471 [Bacteroidetes bacterium ADurb.Bin174]